MSAGLRLTRQRRTRVRDGWCSGKAWELGRSSMTTSQTEIALTWFSAIAVSRRGFILLHPV